jgi:hypothetical protein
MTYRWCISRSDGGRAWSKLDIDESQILPISMAESGFGEQQTARRDDYALAAKRREIIDGDEGESHTS